MGSIRRLIAVFLALTVGAALAVATLRAAGGEKVKPAPPPELPRPPAPPVPPKPPHVEVLGTATKRYNLKEGESHKGDLYFMSESVTIAGKQEGDLSVFGKSVDVPGTVTGDLNAWVQSADLSGHMGDAVRVFCQELRVSGHVEGDLIAVCASVRVEEGAHITGSVNAKGADIEVRGRVDGDVDATGGEVTLGAQVGGDAKLKADVIQVEPESNVAGDLDYASRGRLEVPFGVVHGAVTYTPEVKEPRVSRHGFLKWFWWMVTALLTGLGLTAIFRRGAEAMATMVRVDGLKSAGVGFITLIVVPVASVLSCILIITIPAAVLVLLAFVFLLYLSQIPVATMVGGALLSRLRPGAHSPFAAVAAGMPLIYLVFAIPFLGKLALFATLFTGLGAMVMTLWAARQARRPGGAPPTAPSSAVPPVVGAPLG